MKKLSIILSIIILAGIIVCGLIYGIELYNEKKYDNTVEPYIKDVVDEDVVVSGDTAYVDCQILINLKKKTAKRKLEKWIEEDGGIIVGEIPISNTYQIEFPEGSSKEDLERITEQLEKEKEVEIAILHYAILNDTDEINYIGETWAKTQGDDPKDPFSDVSTIWNSVYPDGPNWWAEAIWLSGIGNMDVQFSDINVGIIDSMFDTAHMDLKGAFEKTYQNPKNVAKQYSDAESSEDEELKNRTGEFSHGTHVSGIIGARVNNFGISGVAPNTHLYGFAMKGEDLHRYSGTIEEQYAVITLLQNNVRLINMSMGLERVHQAVIHKQKGEGLTADTSEVLSQLEKSRVFLESFYRRCEQHYDFLLFKSAGNANNIKLVEASKEDENSDLIPTCAGYREYDSDTDKGKNFETVEGVSVEDSPYYFDDEKVRSSIVFVGAIERMDKNGKFNPADFSCVGADIMAPGRDILSDLPNDGVGYMSGTSMATPIATGTAAMVWSANPDLTAAQVREILLKTSRPFRAVKKNKVLISDTSMLNSFQAVYTAVESRNNPEFKKKPEKAAENLTVIMGTMYEEAENSPSVNLDNVPDIKLTVANDKESYQMGVESLGEDGTFIFFVKPGTYKLTIDCSYYDHYETEVKAEEGDTECYAFGLGREEVKKRILNEYASSLNTFYNGSYQYTISRYRSSGRIDADTTVEGFDAERKLGYAIDDFDDDGEYELLVLATDEHFNILYEMYTVNGDEVSLVTREITVADDHRYITLPDSSGKVSEECALISCFVEEQTHNIYLQISYNISIFIDGQCTYITSIRYEDGDFCDLQGFSVKGSSCEYGYPKNNMNLLRMGVHYPDIEAIFEKLSPLYSCFDDGVYEVFHAIQKTIDTQYDENGWLSSIQATTLFSSREDLYNTPRKNLDVTVLSVQEQHDLYTPVIEKYYRDMKSAEVAAGDSGRTAYFGYVDIDGNGIEELMLDYAEWISRDSAIRYGYAEAECFALYTIEDRKVVPVIESGYNRMGSIKVPFVHLYPGISLVERGKEPEAGNHDDSTSEFYVYRDGKIHDKPVFSVSNEGGRYEINSLKVSREEYENLFDELYHNSLNSCLNIYNEEDYHRQLHGE